MIATLLARAIWARGSDVAQSAMERERDGVVNVDLVVGAGFCMIYFPSSLRRFVAHEFAGGPSAFGQSREIEGRWHGRMGTRSTRGLPAISGQRARSKVSVLRARPPPPPLGLGTPTCTFPPRGRRRLFVCHALATPTWAQHVVFRHSGPLRSSASQKACWVWVFRCSPSGRSPQ